MSGWWGRAAAVGVLGAWLAACGDPANDTGSADVEVEPEGIGEPEGGGEPEAAYVGTACDGFTPRDLSWIQEVCGPVASFDVEVSGSWEADIVVALSSNAPNGPLGQASFPAVGSRGPGIARMQIALEVEEPVALVHVPAALTPSSWEYGQAPYTLGELREAVVGRIFESGARLMARLPEAGAVVVDGQERELPEGFFHLVRLRADRGAEPLRIAGRWSATYHEGTSYCRYTTTPPPSVGFHARPSVCGDGMIEAGESCDDGNGVDGDGCDDCRVSALVCEGEEGHLAWACQGESVSCVQVECVPGSGSGVCGEVPEQSMRVRVRGRLVAEENPPARIKDEAAGLDCRCTEGVRAACSGDCRWAESACQRLDLSAEVSAEGIEVVGWGGVPCEGDRCAVVADEPRSMVLGLDTGRRQVERREPGGEDCFDLMALADGGFLGRCYDLEGARTPSGQVPGSIARLEADARSRVWSLDLSRWGDAAPRALAPLEDGGALAVIEAIDAMNFGCQAVAPNQSILVRISATGEPSPLRVFQQYEYPSHMLVRADGSIVVAGPGPRVDGSWGLNLYLLDEAGAQVSAAGGGPIEGQAMEVRLAEDGMEVLVLATHQGEPDQGSPRIPELTQDPGDANLSTLSRLDPDAGWGAVWRQQWRRTRDFYRRPSIMDVGPGGFVAVVDRFSGDEVREGPWGRESVERLVIFRPGGEVAWTGLLDPADGCAVFDHAVLADPESDDFYLLGHRECLGDGFDASSILVERMGADGVFRWSERFEALRPFEPDTNFWGILIDGMQIAPQDGRLLLLGYGAALFGEEVGVERPRGPVRLYLDR